MRHPHGNRLSRLLAVTTSGAAIAFALAAPAQAMDPTPRADECTPNDHIEIPYASGVHMPAAATYYKDGPGGTMTVSVVQSSTVGSSVSVSAGVSVSNVVAEVQVEVSQAATTEVSITTGHEWSRDISAGMFGNAQYGSWGWNINWQKVRVYSDCGYTVLGSGSGQVASAGVGWNYWETGS